MDTNLIIYTATDGNGCPANLCCPVRIRTQACAFCSASVSQIDTPCNNNGTTSNSTDDWFTVMLTGNISMGSGNYVVKMGTYTSPITPSGSQIVIIGNGQLGNPTFLADGTSTYTLRIEDAYNSSCFTTVVVGPVDACSFCPYPNCITVTIIKS